MEKESLKILKRMAFPNMDKIESAGANLPKLVSCISTRMVILEEAKALLQIHVTKKMEKLKADQATSETITKTGSVKTMERKLGCRATCTLHTVCHVRAVCFKDDGTPLNDL